MVYCNLYLDLLWMSSDFREESDIIVDIIQKYRPFRKVCLHAYKSELNLEI